MAAFVVPDSSDEACAKLKAHFEAREASFNAALAGMFKSPPERPRAPAAAPAAKPVATGSAPPANRKRSSYSRLRKGR